MVSKGLHHGACPQGVLAVIICPLTSSLPLHPRSPQHSQHVPLITVVYMQGQLEVNETEDSKKQDWETCLG